MPTPNPLLRYATDEFVADGVTTDWEISFVGGYIAPEHVFAMSVVIDPATGLATDRQSHTVEIIASGPNSATARVAPAVANQRKLFIYRSTPVTEMLVNYVNGSIISRKNLNLSNDQLLKIIQEMIDNLNITSLTVDQQVGTIVDLTTLIQQIYNQVIELLESTGIIGVAPKVWAGAWEGEYEGVTDFPIPAADVTDAAFYDVYIDNLGMIPVTDYTVIIDEDNPANSAIRFTEPRPTGSKWFAVLRGFAKPYAGPPPISQVDLRVPVYNVDGGVFFADKDVEFGLVNLTASAGCVVTIRAASATNTIGTGSYISFLQTGGEVTIGSDAEVTLKVPVQCVAATRGLNATVTATCIDADNNIWLLSGDLAKEA